jgi:signal transduction histidine kinase
MQNMKDLILELNHHTSLVNSKVIHDYNNPLTVVIGQLSILSILLDKEDIDRDRLKAVLAKVLKSTDDLQEKTLDFRKYYKLLCKHSDVKSTQQVIDAACFYFSTLKETHNIVLKTDIAENFTFQASANNLVLILKVLIFSFASTVKNAEILISSKIESDHKIIELGFALNKESRPYNELLTSLLAASNASIDYQPSKTVIILDT